MEKKSINFKNYSCSFTVEHVHENIGVYRNRACWGNISSIILNKYGKYILIEDFKCKETEKYIKPLIKIINKITPCELINVNNEEIIRFKLLSTYDQNLILLNFIRNLWWSNQCGYNHEVFFETLVKSRYKDSLMRLTKANIVACKDFKGYKNHSNCCKGSDLKLKTTKQLLEYKGFSTQTFLTTN